MVLPVTDKGESKPKFEKKILTRCMSVMSYDSLKERSEHIQNLDR